MARTLVDTYFFDGALTEEQISSRVGGNAIVVNPDWYVGDIRSAFHKLRKLDVASGVVGIHYYGKRDRLLGLSPTLWNNRDAKFVDDIRLIRKAIMDEIGDHDEEKLFPSVNKSIRREFDIPDDAPCFDFDRSFVGGNFPRNVKNLADALDEQIRDFLKTRFIQTFEPRTLVMKVVVSS